jgi:hypothetical protein
MTPEEKLKELRRSAEVALLEWGIRVAKSSLEEVHTMSMLVLAYRGATADLAFHRGLLSGMRECAHLRLCDPEHAEEAGRAANLRSTIKERMQELETGEIKGANNFPSQ